MMRGVDWNQVQQYLGIAEEEEEEEDIGIHRIMSKAKNLSDTQWPLLR